MIETLLKLMGTGTVTQRELFPSLAEHARGLPQVTQVSCNDCEACEKVCPSGAVSLAGGVSVDLGRCLACGLCVETCPTGTLVANRRTDVAVRSRSALVLRQDPPEPAKIEGASPFRRSLHVRVVSCGDSASDLETAAAHNPIFDGGRFGIHVVASPRFADALVVTGPVGLAMHEPLQRCYEAMSEPRLVVAVGTSAISGGLLAGGYAQANGVDGLLPVAAYVPGNPPHPWSVLHGLMLAMRHPLV